MGRVVYNEWSRVLYGRHAAQDDLPDLAVPTSSPRPSRSSSTSATVKSSSPSRVSSRPARFGWYVNQKASITVDGKTLSVQVGSNLIVVGSKEATREDGSGARPAASTS